MSLIIDADGRQHRTYPQDLLWLGRALDGEGGDELAVAATLIQRWAMLGGEDFGPLGTMIQYYSQPIHPEWLSTGSHCVPGGNGHNTRACSAEVTARRAARRVARWEDLRREARDAAIQALYSRDAETRLPLSVHFADADLVRRKMRGRTARTEGWQILPDQGDGHLYLSTTASRAGRAAIQVVPGQVDQINQITGRAPRDTIREPGGELATTSGAEGGGGGLLLLGLLAAGGAAAYAAKSGGGLRLGKVA